MVCIVMHTNNIVTVVSVNAVCSVDIRQNCRQCVDLLGSAYRKGNNISSQHYMLSL